MTDTTQLLTWDAVLCFDGTVQAAPPKCETCGGKMLLYLAGRCAVTCPDCHGTGHAPHWRIVPEPGTLYELGGQWAVAQAGDIHPTNAGSTPLAPPPSAGLTLHAALALLVDPYYPGVIFLGTTRRWYFDVESEHLRFANLDDEEEPHIYDTAELRLALQRHDALQAYVAGWPQEAQHG